MREDTDARWKEIKMEEFSSSVMEFWCSVGDVFVRQWIFMYMENILHAGFLTAVCLCTVICKRLESHVF